MGRKEGEKRCVSSCEKAAVQLKSGDFGGIFYCDFTTGELFEVIKEKIQVLGFILTGLG